MSNWNTIPAGYQKRTIEKIINEKINRWLKSMDIPSENKLNIKNNVIITGGAIVNLLVGLQPNDFDLYFSDGTVGEEVVNYYLKDIQKGKEVSRVFAVNEGNRIRIQIKSSGIVGSDNANEDYEYFEMSGNDPTSFFDKQTFNKNLRASKKTPNKFLLLLATDNALSLSDDLQIITRFVGNPEEIHKNFDFEHTKSYWTNKTGLIINPNSLECIMSRTLKYTGSLYPLCSMFRLRKFLNRGWSISAGEMLKIGWDISKLNLSDITTLKEQLIGVDVAYFNQLIGELSREFKEDMTNLDRTYLVNLIDRVFSGDFINEENELINEVLEADFTGDSLEK